MAALESELGDAQKTESPAVAEDDDEPVLVESEKTKKAERAHGHVDAGELIKEVVDVKARLEKINKLKETRTGREKLVSAVIQGVGERTSTGTPQEEHPAPEKEVKDEGGSIKMEVKDIAEMDRRLGELERAVGSTTTAADEVYLYRLREYQHADDDYLVDAASTAAVTAADKAQHSAYITRSTSAYRQYFPPSQAPTLRFG